jgi:hypothetical protein
MIRDPVFGAGPWHDCGRWPAVHVGESPRPGRPGSCHTGSARSGRGHTPHPGRAISARKSERRCVTRPHDETRHGNDALAYGDSLNHATRVSVASRKPISEVISLCSSVTTPEATSPMFSSASPVSQITSRPIRRAEATVTEADSLARPGGDSANSTRYPSAVSEDSWASNHARKASGTLPPHRYFVSNQSMLTAGGNGRTDNPRIAASRPYNESGPGICAQPIFPAGTTQSRGTSNSM